MINLATVETRTQELAAGATNEAEIKGKIIEFLWYLKKQGYAESTIKTRLHKIKQLTKRGADLFDPESVKKIIACSNWMEGTKATAVVAYSSFLEMQGETWNPPRYKVPESLPFIPLESEVDALINSCGKKMACFLQGMKDTGADPGELARLEWTDINLEAKSVTIRHPVKGHNPRVIPVSDNFVRRLSVMQRTGNRVFCTLKGLQSNFSNARKTCIRDLANPRILKISFRTLRHWKGTTEYHKTKDIIHVKQLLGHKAIQSTMIYINLEAAIFQTESEEFTVRVAKTLKEACSYVEAGFEYVTDMESSKIFRHRK
jgi:integrase